MLLLQRTDGVLFLERHAVLLQPVGVEQLLPLQRRGRVGRRERRLLMLLLLHHLVGHCAEAQRLGVDVLADGGRRRQRIPRVAYDVRVAQLGHAVYGVLLVLYPRVLVGLLLVAALPALHAQHHHDGGQHGHGHGHGQHDHQQPVDGRLRHHVRLVADGGHVLGPVAQQRDGPFVRAVGPGVAGRALALVTAAAARRHARPAVRARRRHALVHVPAAVLAAEPGPAAAPEIVLQVLARPAVGARLGGHAVVHLALAHVAHVAGHALAPVTVGLGLARAAVQTRALLAVVGQMAVGPGEPGRALARVTETVLARHARRPVPARVRLTVVGRLVTRGPGQADRTVAHVAVARGRAAVVVLHVHARRAVGTRRTRAGRLRGRLTSHALPLARARAAGRGSIFLYKQRDNAYDVVRVMTIQL